MFTPHIEPKHHINAVFIYNDYFYEFVSIDEMDGGILISYRSMF